MVVLRQALLGTTLLVQWIVATDMLVAPQIRSNMECLPFPIFLDIGFIVPLEFW